MKFYKVRSVVLSTALQPERRHEFSALRMYLGEFKRTEDGCFLTEINPSPYSNELLLKDALFDYTFNERESEQIWELAKKLTGKETIDFKIVKTIEI